MKEVPLDPISRISRLNIDKVLTFNYTNTYQKLYDSPKNINYDYLHGNIAEKRELEDNNMVLGIDEYLTIEEQTINIDFIEFKKYYQRILKKTGCKYKEWLEEININKNETHHIYMIGHSLDVTDKDILRDLILAPNVTTTIFYHSKTAYKQYISNLVKVIKQDVLIKKVYGANPSIIFEKQSEEFVQPKVELIF